MKLFKTTDMYTIATLQEMFGFELPKVTACLVKVILIIS